MYFRSEIWSITLMAALRKLACMINNICSLKLTNYYEEICIYLWLVKRISEPCVSVAMADRKGKWLSAHTYFLEQTPNQESLHGSKDMSPSMTRFWALHTRTSGRAMSLRCGLSETITRSGRATLRRSDLSIVAAPRAQKKIMYRTRETRPGNAH